MKIIFQHLHHLVKKMKTKTGSMNFIEYNIIPFENENDDYIEIEKLKSFLINAEIIISSWGVAWPKSSIEEIEESHRGAMIRFINGTTT